LGEALCFQEINPMTSMKNLTLISALVALVALVVVPTAAVAGSLFVALSVVAIFAADYNRVAKPLTSRGGVVAFVQPTRALQNCEQAA
jgi:hypothetical protein